MSDNKNHQPKAASAGASAPGLGADFDDVFMDGAAALQAGRAAEAEAIFRRILARVADQPDALNLLGVALFQQGKVQEAIEPIEKAVSIDGDNPGYQVNLGGIFNQLRRYREAERACRRAIELQPALSGAHNNLGLALEAQGKGVEAVAAFRQAVESDPKNILAFNSLGNGLRRLGRIDEALEAYRAGLATSPDHALTLANLGAALRAVGKRSEALAACRRAVEVAPGFAIGHNNLGNALKDSGDKAGAIGAYREAIRHDPNYAEPRANLGAIYFESGKMAEAEAAFNDALAQDAANPLAHNGLGVVLLATGRTEESAAAFRRAVALKPDYAEAYYNLTSAGPGAMGEAEVTALEATLASGTLVGADRYRLHFALGETLDGRGMAKKAFAHFVKANHLRRQELTDLGRSYKAQVNERMVDNLIRSFSADFFAGAPTSGEPSEKPVFIVGMPRSGTTLVEQIAASHPAVVGLGEAETIEPIIAQMAKEARTSKSFPDCLAELDAAGAAKLAKVFLDRFEPSAGDAERIIDKTPFNFHFLGMIALLFPKARIIHCRRDPRDTGLSCYIQNFRAALPWTTDLAEIGQYWRAYDRLMTHWRSVLPIAMIDVVYEDLVADQEAQSRRLIDFLGLDWDDACLDFHRTKRVVRTASSAQVRRPLYASSVGRWQAYAAKLQPLIDALEGKGES